MKIFKGLFGLILFSLFVSSVDALTYDVETKLMNGIDNSLYEIRLSLKNIGETDYGIAACVMSLHFSDNVKLNGGLRTVNDWSMTEGQRYLFDTDKPVLDENEVVVIPVKVSGNGTLIIQDIECSDGEESIIIDNKIVNITYTPSEENTNNNTNNSNNTSGNSSNTTNNNGGNVVNSNIKDSNCDLSNIILSEGEIEFSSSVTQYELEVSNFSELEVLPILASEKAKYSINKSDGMVVITVSAEDGTNKTYTISVKEVDKVNKVDNNHNVDNSKYVPIFIGITCLLVLINIIRVGKKFISKG